MEHDDDLILGDVDVCGGASDGVKRGTRRKPRCGAKGRGVDSPLSIPSAPSLIAASKLASVFSGYAAEACARTSLSPISATRARQPRRRTGLTPRCPQHCGTRSTLFVFSMGGLPAGAGKVDTAAAAILLLLLDFGSSDLAREDDWRRRCSSAELRDGRAEETRARN